MENRVVTVVFIAIMAGLQSNFVRSQSPGGTSPTGCNFHDAYYNMTTNECDCVEGFVMSRRARKCLPVAAALGADCEEDQQCTKSLGVCTSCETFRRVKNRRVYIARECICGSDYYWSGSDNACLIIEPSKGKIDEHAVQSCPLPITCTFSNGYYNETTKQCDCVDGYTLADDRHECLPVANKLGDECKEHQQCHQKLGVCTSCETVLDPDGKQCICAAGYEWVEKNKACERLEGDDSSGLVQSCRVPINCKLPNGYYNSTTEECTCLEGYVMSNRGRQCLAVAAALGADCEEDQQCTQSLGVCTSCVSFTAVKNRKPYQVSQCVCGSGYYWSWKDHACMIIKPSRGKIDEHAVQSCPLPITCTFSNGYYNETTKQCDCVDGYTLADDRHECLPVANELGDECKEHQQCHQKLGVCTSCEAALGRDEKQCICAAGYEWVEENNSCERPEGDDSSGLVQSCHMPINCKLPNGYYNSDTKECTCLEGYVMARARRECLPVATALGSPCMEDRQCHETLGHSTACEPNIKRTSTRLFLERKCVCAVGYYLKDDTCQKLRVFRNIEMNKCQNDEECSTIISGAECDMETSSCRCSIAPNEDHSECLPTGFLPADFLDPGRF